MYVTQLRSVSCDFHNKDYIRGLQHVARTLGLLCQVYRETIMMNATNLPRQRWRIVWQ